MKFFILLGFLFITHILIGQNSTEANTVSNPTFKYGIGVDFVSSFDHIISQKEKTVEKYFNINFSKHFKSANIEIGLILARKLHATYKGVNREPPDIDFIKKGIPLRGLKLGLNYFVFEDILFVVFDNQFTQAYYLTEEYYFGWELGHSIYHPTKEYTYFREENPIIMTNLLGIGLNISSPESRIDVQFSLILGNIHYFSGVYSPPYRDNPFHYPYQNSTTYQFKVGMKYKFIKDK